MTYTTGIPQDGQSLGSSKPQVRDNFNVLATYLGTNHVALNALNGGMHKFLQMPEQASDPSSGVNIGDLYTKEAQTYTNLFWKQESGGADPLRNQGAVTQMTNILPVNATVGRSFLPGGLLIVWGNLLSGQTTNPTLTTFDWKTANGGEGFTLGGVAAVPFIVLATPNTSAISAQFWTIDNILADTFDLKTIGFPAGRTFNYLLIGPKT